MPSRLKVLIEILTYVYHLVNRKKRKSKPNDSSESK